MPNFAARSSAVSAGGSGGACGLPASLAAAGPDAAGASLRSQDEQTQAIAGTANQRGRHFIGPAP